jgi:hypothetical protein
MLDSNRLLLVWSVWSDWPASPEATAMEQKSGDVFDVLDVLNVGDAKMSSSRGHRLLGGEDGIFDRGLKSS